MTEKIEERTVPNKGNVIQFPKIHPDITSELPLTHELAAATIKDVKSYYNAEALEFVMEVTMQTINNCGYLSDGRRVNTKDLMLLELAIESILHRYQGLDHPLHETVEGLIQIQEADDDSDFIELEDEEFEPQE
jgi:hypothetical protein